MEPVRRVSAMADGGCAVPTLLSRSDEYYERQGRDDQFPPPRLGRCRFSQRTFAAMRGNEQGAPKAVFSRHDVTLSIPEKSWRQAIARSCKSADDQCGGRS